MKQPTERRCPMRSLLGGAVASNVRVGHPLFKCIFPVIMGVLLSGALYLLDERVRAVFPVRV